MKSNEPAAPGKKWMAIALVALIAVILAGATITAGIVYVVHRATENSARSERSNQSKNGIATRKPAPGSPPGSSSSSPSAAGSSQSSQTPAAGGKPAAPYGWMLKDGKLVPAPPPESATLPAPSTPAAPAAATGDPAKDWPLRYERTENGPEADLVVRTGDINNLGFGWPQGYDPFSGNSTPPHGFPWKPKPGSPDGTDRIMLGSPITSAYYAAHRFTGDGYSNLLNPCILGTPDASSCKEREDSMPQPIVLSFGALPPKIDAVLFQIFVDDFQAPTFHSHFQASLNGTRIPSFEAVLNAIDQTGPVGKLITVHLLPEYWPLLKSDKVKLLIDDPTTRSPDGYAVDFVRVLVNPHKFQYQVSLTASVTDADKNVPISGATVTAALQSAATDNSGVCELSGLPAGLVVATAEAPGFDANSVPVDLIAGHHGRADIQLHRHQEGTDALEKAIAQTGSANVYGIHFDTDSAKLRPDSLPALNAVLGLINKHLDSHWIIAGHTDNQGSADHNQVLSENRAASVIAWLKEHGADSSRLQAQGFGPTRPVADNATSTGRALNRRVEVALAK